MAKSGLIGMILKIANNEEVRMFAMLVLTVIALIWVLVYDCNLVVDVLP